ncbi:hypothetical protein [Lysinibacillus xylanilyticus]|uniref:Uncharacterized protein n=1 Tax=Lysinibacillus xylanilyticus TaxID=582475 RepID=A0ABT4ERP4_9BACI|nr:hypothetical protein [Lysinibacillus xylanilyticus]MCY9548339.1 hypothetical protein [Lysinibacillus xylanilyticus]
MEKVALVISMCALLGAFVFFFYEFIKSGKLVFESKIVKILLVVYVVFFFVFVIGYNSK